MRTIHKYKLYWGQTLVPLPKESKFILFAIQDETPCVWYEVDQSITEIENKMHLIHGTGHYFDWHQYHLASCIDVTMVWHLYVEGNK
jgi:hypothetical protein